MLFPVDDLLEQTFDGVRTDVVESLRFETRNMEIILRQIQRFLDGDEAGSDCKGYVTLDIGCILRRPRNILRVLLHEAFSVCIDNERLLSLMTKVFEADDCAWLGHRVDYRTPIVTLTHAGMIFEIILSSKMSKANLA